MAAKVIVLQAGHEPPLDPNHEDQPGAPGEREFNVAVRERLVAALSTDDRFTAVPVPGRIETGTKSDASLFLHADGGDVAARGFHFGYPPASESSKALAGLVRAEFEALPTHLESRADNGGANLTDYYGYRFVDGGAKLVVEHGFVTNPLDRHWLLTNVPQVAKAEYVALCRFFELTPRAVDLGQRTLRLQQPRMEGHDVRLLQLCLSNLGFGPASADAVFGDGTAHAVKRFQQTKGLQDDGVVGAGTRAALAASSPADRVLKLTQPPMQGPDVQWVQQQLTSHGFGPLTPDGTYGPATAEAVRRFQGAHGLPPDGEAGPATKAALAGEPGPKAPLVEPPPMMQFDPAGKPPILSYNVPDEVRHHGRLAIDLQLPLSLFRDAARPAGVDPSRTGLAALARPDVGGGGLDDVPTNHPNPPKVIELVVTKPANGETIPGEAPHGAMIELAGTARMASGTGSVAAVDVQVGGEPPRPAEPGSPGNWATWTAKVTVPVTSTVEIKVIATHSGGVVKKDQPVVVDVVVNPAGETPSETTPPTVTITSPQEFVIAPPEGSFVDITGSAADEGSGVDRVELTVDGARIQDAEPMHSDLREWRRPQVFLTRGRHRIVAKAFDRAGNGSGPAVRNVTLAEEPATPPRLLRLLLVESYELASYRSTYGAGATLKTFSLWPGEQMTIAMKSYQRTEETRKLASSILDSQTQESAEEFEQATAREQTYKENYDESFKYTIRGDSSANWGWGSAKVSGEVSGNTNAVREEFAKNTTNAIKKHAAKASANRKIEVSSEQAVKSEAGEETAIERTIQNINVSRTLNIVARQLLQVIISLLYLTDVRVAFVRVDDVPGTLFRIVLSRATGGTFTLTVGDQSTPPIPRDATPESLQSALEGLANVEPGEVSVSGVAGGPFQVSFELAGRRMTADGSKLEGVGATVAVNQEQHRVTYREASLPQLNSLLAEVLVDDNAREQVLGAIKHQLENVWDFEDRHWSVIEEGQLTDRDGQPVPNSDFLRFRKRGLVHVYRDATTGTEIAAPGVIVAASKNTMRTDSVILDALLGGGVALDNYSKDLQVTAVEERRLANEGARDELARQRLAVDLVRARDETGAKIYEHVFELPPGTVASPGQRNGSGP
jgi:hypothetical protein